jgi:capsular exopolysaccharide synthesis family protein
MDPDALASHALLITHFDPKSPVAEAYRTLRTKIQFARMERMAKTIVVTSPSIQEGKTTTIVNLALTMAQNGQKTLLVGSNLRRPSIHRFFGIDREPGLSDILIGNAQWRDCIRTVADMLMGRFEMEDIMAAPGLDNLHIIEAGPVPANPSELLSMPAMGEFLRAVREEYDIILIDTPPVMPVTDSTIVAGQVDAVVLVYQAGKIGRAVLKRAKIHLESAHARVLGVVLNDVQTEVAGYQYAHHYTHYYGEESTAPAAPSRLGRLWQAIRARAERVRGGGKPTRPAGGGSGEPSDVWRARTRSGGYRNMTLGLVLVAGLAAALGGALAWRNLRPAPTPPRPREALRERLDAPRTLPVAAVSASPSAEPARESKARPSTNGSAAGYALEVGPFASAKEAEDAEHRMTEAGYATMRVRHAPGAAAYVVLIDRIATPKDGDVLVQTLRGQGFGDALVVEDGGTPAVRVSAPRPLRDAVGVAERLRGLGHPVRVASQSASAEHFVVRHGTYPSREAASEKGEALKRLGFAPQIVRVR